MSAAQPHLTPVPDPPESASGGKGGGGGGNNIEGRISSLETHLKYLATKEDLQKLKVWWLGGIIAGMGLAAMVALGVLRFFLPA